MNLKELSQHLNLSQTTVSRALNGYPEVSEATRARVKEAALRMGYSPNARAKGLATGRAQAIGHVLPVSTQNEMVNPVFGDFLAGAGESYARAGYEVMISLADDTAEERAYRALRNSGNVDGLIVHAPRRQDPRIPLLTELGLPFVVHGRSTETEIPYSWVDTNNRRAFRRATEFLLDLNHRRIALINGIEHLDFALRRREGYAEALTARGLQTDPALMCSEEMTEIYGYRAARRMLAGDDPPTAFLVSSMITAIGVRRAVHELGLELGLDISVITHDDDLGYLKNGHDVPIFTATRSSVRAAGRQAAEMLLKLIDRPESGPMSHRFEAELIIGASTGPAHERMP
ncbi:LacI family DNA-binding transcriptional regulator [Pseudoponticoccus marisrubri]|uniref:LacI family transcriptional regulator n=1 Tax=Pseudoponticoccus marisrubri TaxID=1685382 RepID=A0A0W7WMP9_9RHOB|nr:LacI family DNA-binding transcriptional regulator [Pseudoponticoccus marisrubri]KUF11869.1 LacI family transcriptional regulator [Pseudoponticoccus marisrubri]